MAPERGPEGGLVKGHCGAQRRSCNERLSSLDLERQINRTHDGRGPMRGTPDERRTASPRRQTPDASH
jgi:hypothetical protein